MTAIVNTCLRRDLIAGAAASVVLVLLPFDCRAVGPAMLVAGTAASTVFKNIGQGASAFKSLFDNQGVDMGRLVREVIEEVRAAVHFEILVNEQRKLEATANALQNLMHDYLNTPNPLLLNGLHEKAVLAVAEAESLKVAGIPTYGLLGTLMLAVYQEQYLRARSKGASRNLKHGAQRLVNGVDVLRTALREHTEKRFRKLWGDFALGGFIDYLLDGKQYTLGGSARSADSRFSVLKDDKFKHSERELMSDLYALRDGWKGIASS